MPSRARLVMRLSNSAANSAGSAAAPRPVAAMRAGSTSFRVPNTSTPAVTSSARIPAIVFTKGGGQWLEAIADTGADVVGLDWTTDLGATRRRVGDRVALQGNLDPMALFAPPAAIQAEARAALDSFGASRNPDGSTAGHIFNLGHGISQFTPPEHVAALVEAVHSHSRRLHSL